MIVVKAPPQPVEVSIGGVPAVTSTAEREPGGAAADDGQMQIGKRYVDEANTIELLCTRAGAGAGTPTLEGAPLSLRDAKPLPASD